MSQTVVAIDHDEDMVEVSTNDRKWINKMVKLEAEGHATEVDSEIEGNREWEAEIGLFRLPFYRKPRTYTKKQRADAAKRLGSVRKKVAAKRAADAEDEEDEEEEAPVKKPARKKKVATRRKKKAVPEPVEEEEVDDEDIEDEIDEDEDEEEAEPEVVVKTKSTRRRRRKKAS